MCNTEWIQASDGAKGAHDLLKVLKYDSFLLLKKISLDFIPARWYEVDYAQKSINFESII